MGVGVLKGIYMGKTQRKHVSVKKLSARKRGSFVAEKLSVPSVSVAHETGVCEICGKPLKPMIYTGKKRLEDLKDGLVDSKEDGVVVWHEMRSASLCVFYNDVKCPHDKIPRAKRAGSVCLNCAEYARFMLEMEAEDKREEEEMDKERSEWDRRILDEDKSG
jgi:hypothetical protein